MLFPHKITIYDKFEISNGVYQYYRYVLDGVLYTSKLELNVTSKGTVSSDSSLVQVPFSVKGCNLVGYTSTREWLKGDDDFKDKYFTFRQGQLILKGEITLDMSKNKLLDIADIKRNYKDIFTVDMVVTADFGAEKLRHWRLTGR